MNLWDFYCRAVTCSNSVREVDNCIYDRSWCLLFSQLEPVLHLPCTIWRHTPLPATWLHCCIDCLEHIPARNFYWYCSKQPCYGNVPRPPSLHSGLGTESSLLQCIYTPENCAYWCSLLEWFIGCFFSLIMFVICKKLLLVDWGWAHQACPQSH